MHDCQGKTQNNPELHDAWLTVELWLDTELIWMISVGLYSHNNLCNEVTSLIQLSAVISPTQTKTLFCDINAHDLQLLACALHL